MQKAGLWRRGAAALVDMVLALVLLQGLAAVGFQLTGGRVTSGLSLSTDCTSVPATGLDLDLPQGASLPARLVPDRVALCRSGVLGATTGLAYVLSRTERHVGLDVTTSYAVPIDTAWRAAGGRVDLDPFLLPLFVLIRWAFDRFAGATPGRALARIRVAEAESVGARVGAALGHDLDCRYLLFARPYAPILIVGAAEALYGIATGGPSLVFRILAAVAVGVAVAFQLVAAAAIAQGRSASYDLSYATLVGLLDEPGTGSAIGARPPWRQWLTAPGWVTTCGCVAAVGLGLGVGLSRPPPAQSLRPPPVAMAPAVHVAARVPVPPRPAEAGEPTPPLFAPDAVAARLAQAAEAAAKAEALAERGNPSAVADLVLAIEMEQGATDTDTSRAFAFEAERIVGHNLFIGGDLPDAIDEDTRALNLQNGDVGVLKQRAVAEFYGGQPADALADLDVALPNAPGDVEIALWREIVAHRLGRASRFEADTFSNDAAGWPGALVALYRGQSSPEALRAHALDFDLSRWVEYRCEAEFFIGEWHVIRGETDAARDALRTALKDCPGTAMEAHAAEDELLGRAGFE